RAAASREVGTVTRTISQPARARRRICSAVAVTSAVSGVVIDWTRIGLLPPIPTSPTRTSRVGRLLQPKGSGFIATAGILHSAGEPGNNAGAGPDPTEGTRRFQREAPRVSPEGLWIWLSLARICLTSSGWFVDAAISRACWAAVAALSSWRAAA